MYRALGNLLKASGGLAKKGGRAAADVFLPKDTSIGELVAMTTPDVIGMAILSQHLPENASAFEKGAMLAGTGLGSIGGGIAARNLVGRIPGAKKVPGLGLATDFVGSYGGDMIGSNIGLSAGAMMNRGENMYERMDRDQRNAFAQQVERETLIRAGLIPGGQYDEFLSSNGLA